MREQVTRRRRLLTVVATGAGKEPNPCAPACTTKPTRTERIKTTLPATAGLNAVRPRQDGLSVNPLSLSDIDLSLFSDFRPELVVVDYVR